MKIVRAQSVMESTLAFIAGMLLFGAAIAIWAWGNSHIPIRQMTFEGTRFMAGQSARSVDAGGAQGGQKFVGYPVYYAYPLPPIDSGE